ncbi:hypothetical protein [Borreliella afzelii]|uniref:hypothetical protein n=2 Tax=Borreliella afzelii TaxID=29518 RepID=UPI003BF4E2C8
MNKKMRMFIICIFFTLIISCKNYASSEDLKNLEQNVKGKVKGFLDTKERIVSDDPTVYEIAEKLKEEELKGKKESKQEQEDKEELMQGDDPANIDLPSILQTNNQDSTPALEAAQQITSGGQQKEEEKGKEEKEQAKAEEVKVKEEQKGEQAKAKAEQEKKEKEERERKEKEKQQQEQQKKRQEEEKKKQEEQEKAKAEKERREKEERQRQEQEERQIKSKIETLTKKIDEINRDIDSIKYKSWFVENEKRLEVKATEVRDKVTGPIYDHFTNDANTAIYYTWNLEDEEDLELGKLLEKLSNTRNSLRTKLNENNATYTLEEPKLKENVKIEEIESDLDELKSELEEVKGYLKNESNFEKIKEYVYSSDY